MGASDFCNSWAGTDADEAFNEAREAAAWEHGHGGYTGTLAEKGDFTLFGQIARDDIDKVKNLIDAADWQANAAEARAELEKLYPGKSQALIDNFRDKWGPAAAFQYDGGFVFMGYASS